MATIESLKFKIESLCVYAVDSEVQEESLFKEIQEYPELKSMFDAKVATLDLSTETMVTNLITIVTKVASNTLYLGAVATYEPLCDYVMKCFQGYNMTFVTHKKNYREKWPKLSIVFQRKIDAPGMSK